LVVFRTVFEISTHKAVENSSFSPPHHCLTPRSWGTCQNFSIKLTTQKLEGLGCSESCIIPTSTFLTDPQPDRRTDGDIFRRQSHVWTGLYAVAR